VYSCILNSATPPYLKQSGSQINSTNTITATFGATLHAADEVRLMPGFEAHSGSELHIYNDGCTGTYYRMAYSGDDSDATIEEEGIYQHEVTENNYSEVNIYAAANKNTSNEKFTIAPNPTTGEVNINVYEKSSTLLLIAVYDVMGSKVFEMPASDAKHYWLNLGHLSNGMYSVRLTFADSSESKLLIKQSD
jgi:hypothetical protein